MNKERLIQAGIDYEEGVRRFGGSTQIYEKFLMKFFEKDELPVLRKTLEAEDYEAAFRIVHDLKGGAGNLSISAYFRKICEIVEALRMGMKDQSLLVLLQEAEDLYNTAYLAVKGELYEKED